MILNKKILINTVYNSENCGSFLQAWSLYRVLEQRGYEVAFLKRELKHSSHSFGLHLLNASKDIIKLRFSHAYAVIKEWFIFNKLQKQFKIVSYNSPFFRDASLQIIGSDTLWNFESDYFRSKADTYLGYAFSPKPSITYAVSVANTPEELFAKTTRAYKDEMCIKKYLVRDLHTANLVRAVFNKEATIVCDPTMLLAPSDFEILEKSKPEIDNYLLIYCFGNLETMKEAIISYAKKKGLKTVSLLSKRDWCDYSVEENPQLMVTYYRYATCIVSNTFHGTALSIIYEKPFAVIDEGKIKVKELLQMYRHEERLISTPKLINKCLDTIISEEDRQQYESIKKQSFTLLFKTISDEINR